MARQSSFGQDDWLGVWPLRSLIFGPLHETEYKLHVRDLWEGGTWNLTVSPLALHLPVHTLQLIRSCSCMPLGKKDAPSSTFAPKGIFNLSLAYSSLKPPLHRDHDLSWIWKLKTLPKIKIFIWLCFWDRLPHRTTLATRGVPITPTCPVCHDIPEDSLHILRECPRAITLWNTLPTHQNFFALDLKQWLHFNLTIPNDSSASANSSLPWPSLFSFCLWHLWLRRNETTFKSYNPPLYSWKPRLMAQAWEFYPSLPHFIVQPQTPHITWPSPTPTGWTMLRTDGSWNSLDFTAGIGGFFSDSNDKWKLGFQKRLSAKDALSTELAAIIEGLSIAWNRGWHKLIILTDSSASVKMLRHDANSVFHAHTNLILQCRDWMAKLLDVEINYLPRQENDVADLI